MSPLFFDAELVGSKSHTGLFSGHYNLTSNQDEVMNPELIDTDYGSSTQLFNRNTIIPTYEISKQDYLKQNKIYLPVSNRDQGIINKQGKHLIITLQIHAVQLIYQKQSKYDHHLKNVIVVYEPSIWLKQNDKVTYFKHYRDAKTDDSIVLRGYTLKPVSWLKKNLAKFAADFVYQDYLQRLIADFDLSKAISDQASDLSEHVGQLLAEYGSDLLFVKHFLAKSVNWRLTFADYRQIYQQIQKLNLSPIQFNQLVSANEYLLLIANLEQLKQINRQIPVPKHCDFAGGNYNKAQRKAIISNQPLNLLQSVAGSGKSHTILGRIAYLLKSGVKAEEITVLSFTNAAADHITNSVKGNINSLTISKMVHEIYQANSTNLLSNTQTLINSLILHNQDHNDVIQDLISLLYQVENNQKQAQNKLMHFISVHYNTITQKLNEIRQTTLILEEIYCYLKLEKWQDPFPTKYLIVDEVQDTSVYQFIYLLHYACFHKLNVFFVGDASQTLYEFRNADPNALNALEASGYFATYKLETNYRSCPEILQYANTVLRDIKANQYAHLMLRPAKKEAVTKDSFLKHVKYLDSNLNSRRDLTDNNLYALYKQSVASFLQDKLAKKQKTAFLGYTQKEAQVTKDVLEALFPQAKTVLLSPARSNSFNFLSRYLAEYSSELKFYPSQDFVSFLIDASLGKLSSKERKKIDPDELSDMLTRFKTVIKPYWDLKYFSYQKGNLSYAKLLNLMEDRILSFEIDYNTENQKLLDDTATQNTEKIKDADFILSTIHGTKGLEFDNCVVLLTNTSHMTQEQRRLYYVALTRAKYSEYLIELSAGDKVMQQKYLQILTDLSDNGVGVA